MLFTAGRRSVFAASRRLSLDDRPASENARLYGAAAGGRWGSGENYVLHAILTGPPDPETGMIANLAEVAERIRGSIDPRYDHRHLNLDTPPFDRIPPTAENIARRILEEMRVAASDLGGTVFACHLMESGLAGATAYSDGRVEREFRLTFSAARQTRSPRLSDAENVARFGKAASPLGHGHGYRLRVVLAGMLDESHGLIIPLEEAHAILASLHADLDHKNLNREYAPMQDQPMTTECLVRHIHRRLSRDLPVQRTRLNETDDFFAETDGRDVSLGITRTFSAAHRMHNHRLSEAENLRIFGRCSYPNGHGHRYTVEATVSAPLDERTGIVYDMQLLASRVEDATGSLDGRHLDMEVEAFRGIRSSSENILRVLWAMLDPALERKLARLRVQETENNRFALRRGAAPPPGDDSDGPGR